MSDGFSERSQAILDELDARCRSPLEVSLLHNFPRALDKVWFPVRDEQLGGDPYLVIGWYSPGGQEDYSILRVGHRFSGQGHSYVLDFVYTVLTCGADVRSVGVDVEVDGHDFHERTKAQAEHDKQRDRIVQGSGLLVARFTGAEVYRDPIAVVQEVDRMARARLFMDRGGR